MRIPRIYLSDITTSTELIQLSNERSHYLANVLRLKANHPVILFNGTENFEFYGVIENADKRKTQIKIIEKKEVNNMPKINIHLGQALSKGDRFDQALQKATELGVKSITPLITERIDVKLPPERLVKKHEHWQKILVSASEQSGRVIVPILNPTTELKSFLKPSDQLGFILSPYSEQNLAHFQKEQPSDIYLIIGPEGGLSDFEVSFACNNGFNPVTLGPRILRTETAPIAIISIIEYIWGDF